MPARWLLWPALAASSALLGWAFERAQFPAALLLGPMLCGIAFGVAKSELKVPAPAFAGAQAIIGILVASKVTGPTLREIAQAWVPMLFVVTTTLLASTFAGWSLTRAKILPGTTAAWGSSPGAAAAMVSLADDFGADARLVAFMQYLRVLLVVLTASLVARFVLHVSADAPRAPSPFADGWGEPLPVLITLAVAAAALVIARAIRLPAGALVGPMLFGGVLHALGYVALTVPGWLLALAYVALGWYIGLRFTRSALEHALRTLPQMLFATLALIAASGLSAWVLTRIFATDPLTAFLATSPGGLDSIAIIAIGSAANLPFVLAAQTLRLFTVILTGPAIARFLSRGA